MSITIVHLDGPLKDRRNEFGDEVGAVVVGRSAEAQIAYPEECIGVSDEHLVLKRDDAGGYTIELCGADDAEIDGQPAEDGTAVSSGSVIALGAGGPSFEVLLPGLTIKHLDGPLAGKRQYFADSVAKIIFGRSREDAQVVYPPDYAVVGVKHFALNRSPAGDYNIELFGKRYVAVDGKPVINGVPVKSGSVLRLGKSDGPAFKADIANRIGPYVKTEQGEEMPEVGGWLRGLSLSAERLGTRTRRLAAGGSVLGVLLGGVIGWTVYEQLHYKWVREHMLQSVYLVVEKNPAGDTAEATAFLIGNGKFATNAHVTEAMRGKVQAFYLLGPKGDRIDIKDVESHPGYIAFKAKALTYAKAGSTSVDNFQPMSLPSAYDVGIIHVDPDAPKSEPLEVDAAPKLAVGDDVITAGFPSEKIRGADNMTKGLAAATFRKGTVESLKDIFFSKSSDDPENLLLVQHGIPATGGMSGSPLVDAWTGKVIAVISGGNTRALPAPGPKDGKSPANLQKQAPERMVDAAQVNYAQRADLLADLMLGTAFASLAEDQAYWEAAGANFTRYIDLALNAFSASRAPDEDQEIGAVVGVLVPGEKDATPWLPGPGGNTRAQPVPVDEALFKAEKSRKTASHAYSFEAEPGFAYGFIVDTIDALPARLDARFAPALSLKLKPAGPFVTDLKPADAGAELPLALTVAVTDKVNLEIVIGGLLQAPVRYTLYAYRWPLPVDLSPAAPDLQPGAAAVSTMPQP
jgi:hypothetical protein